MSLVHEALEKAKREASAKSAQELGLSEARVGAGQPFRAARRIHPAAVAIVAVAVTLGAVGAFVLLSRSKDDHAAIPAAASPSVAPTEATAEPAAAPPSAPVVEAPREPATRATAPPSAESTAPAPAVSAPGVVAQPARVAAAPETKTAPARGDGATKSFVRQMTLDDGTTLRLGGIAWSQEAPLAYLNGKLYAKGESVAGMLIERIERERVLLSGANGRYFLTLR